MKPTKPNPDHIGLYEAMIYAIGGLFIIAFLVNAVNDIESCFP